AAGLIHGDLKCVGAECIPHQDQHPIGHLDRRQMPARFQALKCGTYDFSAISGIAHAPRIGIALCAPNEGLNYFAGDPKIARKRIRTIERAVTDSHPVAWPSRPCSFEIMTETVMPRINP